MSLINVKNLTFAYPGSFDNVFDNVGFRLDTAWRLGLVGRNGKGKTTLLKLLDGQYEYDGTIDSTVNFYYFPFEVKDKNQSVLNVLGELCPDAQSWEISKELNLIGLSEEIGDRSFSTLSEGEKTRALLVALFLAGDGFALIDEPTNHLDMDSRRALGTYLSGKSGFILVSHDRRLLDRCVDHIMSINRADIEIRKGNFSDWERDKESRDRLEQEQNCRLKKDIERLNEAAARCAQWSDKTEGSKKGRNASGLKNDKGFVGHKAAKMMKRSKVIELRRERAAEEKQALLKNVEESEELKIFSQAYPKRSLMELKDCSLFYGERRVCGPLSFVVENGDRIVLSGKNGCGKSSVLKLAVGEPIKHTGSFSAGQGLKISYLPQSVDFLKGSLRDYALQRSIDESLLKTILRKLGLERTQLEKDMSEFSAGQKKKAALAACLCERAHLYVWDEPLNYVDVLSRIQLERLLVSFSPTILFVEHDETFVNKVATKVICLD